MGYLCWSSNFHMLTAFRNFDIHFGGGELLVLHIDLCVKSCSQSHESGQTSSVCRQRCGQCWWSEHSDYKTTDTCSSRVARGFLKRTMCQNSYLGDKFRHIVILSTLYMIPYCQVWFTFTRLTCYFYKIVMFFFKVLRIQRAFWFLNLHTTFKILWGGKI